MSELKKAVYLKQRTFEKYDEGRIILYPNETVIENYQPETPEGSDSKPEMCTAYQYEGEEPDGGYIRECGDPTNYHDVANAIMRTRYELSEELALQRHYQNSPTDYADAWKEYCAFADSAADKARAWLGVSK